MDLHVIIEENLTDVLGIPGAMTWGDFKTRFVSKFLGVDKNTQFEIYKLKRPHQITILLDDSKKRRKITQCKCDIEIMEREGAMIFVKSSII